MGPIGMLWRLWSVVNLAPGVYSLPVCGSFIIRDPILKISTCFNQRYLTIQVVRLVIFIFTLILWQSSILSITVGFKLLAMCGWVIDTDNAWVNG